MSLENSVHSIMNEERTNHRKKKVQPLAFFPARLFRTPSPSSSPTEFSYNFLPRIYCFRRIDLRPHSVTIDDILFFSVSDKQIPPLHSPSNAMTSRVHYVHTNAHGLQANPSYNSGRASGLRPLSELGYRGRTGARLPCTRWRRRASGSRGSHLFNT